MKSDAIFISIIIILVLSTLVSCNSTKNEIVLSEDDIKTTTSTQEQIAIPNIDVEILTMSSYDEYLNFINSTELPDNFVYFDYIDQIGDFRSLVILADHKRGDYSRYMYFFADEKYHIALRIDHDENIEDVVAKCKDYGFTLTSDINSSDMRTIKADKKQMFFENDILYTYIDNRLSSIRWQSEEILYTVSGDSFIEYLHNSYEAGSLLSIQTAKEFIGELTQEMNSAKK